MSAKLSGSGPVVLVDDDRDALRLCQIVFGESKVTNRLLLMHSGTELLRYLRSTDPQDPDFPSLVLLDINMPDYNGFEVLTAVRKLPHCDRLPMIVMLTASNQDRDIERAMKLGANGYQVKPFGIDEFIAFASSLL